MALERPKSMSEIDYYTRRAIDEGKAEVWVVKIKCDCGGVLKKPKMRATEYICESCDKSVSKEDYVSKQIASVLYTCPKCKHVGEKQVPFIRKKVGMMIKGKRKSVESFQFECDKCSEKINVTKKLKG